MTEVSVLPSWVSDLTGDNFLAVYDVVLDMCQELQLCDEAVIPLFQPMLKFPSLMPRDGINMRDRYCDLRWKAIGLLKKQGIIKDFKLLKGPHRWQSKLQVFGDPERITSFMGAMDSEFSCRSERSDTEEPPPPKDVAQFNDTVELVMHILSRFHAIAVQLRQRHENRPTLDVSDEYDVQDLLHALLCIHFDDIRPEEWTPSYAGKSSRVDFLLKPEQTVIEVKKTRQGLGAKEVGDQLILDIARYSKHPNCKTLICMVYDPENRVQNPGGLEADLGCSSNGMRVEVIVVPKQY